MKAITVMSAGAVQAVVARAGEAYRAGSGREVAIAFGTVGALKERVAAGEQADILILSEGAIADLARLGKADGASVVRLGGVGVGVAVPEGAPRPDIATPEALRQVLLAAPSLIYADPAKGASSGIHFAAVLETLGIADAVKDKAILAAGGRVVMEMLAAGRAAIGVNQISEILPVAGVSLVGPLPAALQKITAYAAAVTTTAAEPAAAADFLRFVAGPAMAADLAAAGFSR